MKYIALFILFFSLPFSLAQDSTPGEDPTSLAKKREKIWLSYLKTAHKDDGKNLVKTLNQLEYLYFISLVTPPKPNQSPLLYGNQTITSPVNCVPMFTDKGLAQSYRKKLPQTKKYLIVDMPSQKAFDTLRTYSQYYLLLRHKKFHVSGIWMNPTAGKKGGEFSFTMNYLKKNQKKFNQYISQFPKVYFLYSSAPSNRIHPKPLMGFHPKKQYRYKRLSLPTFINLEMAQEYLNKLGKRASFFKVLKLKTPAAYQAIRKMKNHYFKERNGKKAFLQVELLWMNPNQGPLEYNFSISALTKLLSNSSQK